MVAASWLAKPLNGAAAIDPKRPCRQRQQAHSLGICGMHDDRYHAAKLYFIFLFFNKISGNPACVITLLNARARSSGI